MSGQNSQDGGCDLPNKRAASAVGIEVSLYDVVWKNVILTVSQESDSCFVPIPGSVLCHLSMP